MKSNDKEFISNRLEKAYKVFLDALPSYRTVFLAFLQDKGKPLTQIEKQSSSLSLVFGKREGARSVQPRKAFRFSTGLEHIGMDQDHAKERRIKLAASVLSWLPAENLESFLKDHLKQEELERFRAEHKDQKDFFGAVAKAMDDRDYVKIEVPKSQPSVMRRMLQYYNNAINNIEPECLYYGLSLAAGDEKFQKPPRVIFQLMKNPGYQIPQRLELSYPYDMDEKVGIGSALKIFLRKIEETNPHVLKGVANGHNEAAKLGLLASFGLTPETPIDKMIESITYALIKDRDSKKVKASPSTKVDKEYKSWGISKDLHHLSDISMTKTTRVLTVTHTRNDADDIKDEDKKRVKIPFEIKNAADLDEKLTQIINKVPGTKGEKQTHDKFKAKDDPVHFEGRTTSDIVRNMKSRLGINEDFFSKGKRSR